MKKNKLVTLAVFLTCIQGYGLQPTEYEVSLRRGAVQPLSQNINEIRVLRDGEQRSYPISPRKNNSQDIIRGYSGYLVVKRVQGEFLIDIYGENILKKYSLEATQLDTCKGLTKFEFGPRKIEIF